jgi:hypothetical protein
MVSKINSEGLRDLPPLDLSPPRPWTFLGTVLVLFTVAVVIWIAYLHVYDPVVDARFGLATSHTSEDVWRILYICIFFCVLQGMQAVFWVPVLSQRAKNGWYPNLFYYTGCAAALAPILCAFTRRIKSRLQAARQAVIAVSLAVTIGGLATWAWCNDGVNQFFFAYRTIELRFGSSPAWPLLGALSALLLFCFVHITRLYLAAYQQPRITTEGLHTALAQKLTEAYAEFCESTQSVTGMRTVFQQGGFCCLVGAIVILSAIFRLDRCLASIDGPRYDILLLCLQASVTVAILLTCWHIKYLWYCLQSCLACLSAQPFVEAFTAPLPAAGNRPIWVRRLNLQSLSLHIRSAVVLHDLNLLKEKPESQPFNEKQEAYRESLRALLADPKKRIEALEHHTHLRDRSTEVAAIVLKHLAASWQTAPLMEAYFKAPEAANPQPQPYTATRLESMFVAMHYSSFILYGIRQIQNLIWFVSIGFALLVLSTTSYASQAPQVIGRGLIIIFCVIAFTLWRVLSGMERNVILSKLAGTKEGQLNAEFYVKFLGYGGLPVLGLLASEFPSVSNFLFSWVEPTLEAFR